MTQLMVVFVPTTSDGDAVTMLAENMKHRAIRPTNVKVLFGAPVGGSNGGRVLMFEVDEHVDALRFQGVLYGQARADGVHCKVLVVMGIPRPEEIS